MYIYVPSQVGVKALETLNVMISNNTPPFPNKKSSTNSRLLLTFLECIDVPFYPFYINQLSPDGY